MRKQSFGIGRAFAAALILGGFVFSINGCGGGGAAASTSTGGSLLTASRTLSWAPPTAYQDNSPLYPDSDLERFDIYIHSDAAFTDDDVASATAGATSTSMDLLPVCTYHQLPPGTYYVSIRAVAKNGMMSDFSPSAAFSI